MLKKCLNKQKLFQAFPHVKQCQFAVRDFLKPLSFLLAKKRNPVRHSKKVKLEYGSCLVLLHLMVNNLTVWEYMGELLLRVTPYCNYYYV